MIKFFVLVGVIGGAAITYNIVFLTGPISQSPPSESLLAGYRAQGFIPASVNLEEDETAEESEVFDVPQEDAVMLGHTLDGTMSMPGMDMSGMDMSGMDMSGDSMSAMDMSGMDMSGDSMAGMKMDSDAEEEEHMGGDGFVIAHEGEFDREIKLTMAEWKYSQMQIDIKMDERIKFTVTNEGQIPHEFMFMDMPNMAAVNYRIKRADWSLLEHEALYEKALVLPGGEFSFVMRVTRPGAWMFMCMLPYHMQLGMMGQVATAGMARPMAM